MGELGFEFELGVFVVAWTLQLVCVSAITMWLWPCRPRLRWLFTHPLLLGGLMWRVPLPPWVGQPPAQRADYSVFQRRRELEAFRRVCRERERARLRDSRDQR